MAGATPRRTSTPKPAEPVVVESTAEGTVFGKVTKGQTWTFRAEGRWWDWYVPTGPKGYRNFLADVLDFYPVARGVPFFHLMGRIKEHPDLDPIPIGREATVTMKESGTLELFANDCFYRNNRGTVTVWGSKTTLPPERLDPDFYRGWAGLWRLGRDTFERTQGLISIAVLTLGVCAVLLFVQQGRDLVRTVAESADGGAFWRQVALAVTLLFLSTQAWFWSRSIITSNYGHDRSRWRPRWLLEWTPRVLGVAPFGLVIAAILSNPASETNVLISLSVLAVLFFVFVLFRQDIERRVPWRRDKPPFKIGRLWVLTGLALGAATMVWAIVSPVSFGWTLGPPAVVFLGIGLIMTPLIIAVQTGAAMRVPVLLIALLLAGFSGAVMDNHVIGVGAGPAPDQISLKGAYDQWRAQAPENADGTIPIVLVASEGGASRAGYWTSEVLGKLHDRTGGQFAQSLFAISSVSGGSVGAVGYAATVAENPDAPKVRDQVSAFVGRDFLGPTMVGMLFTDLLQRFIPVAVLPDRAKALESSFEAAWTDHCERPKLGLRCDPEQMRQPFSRIAPSGNVTDLAWRPLVIVNGASEESGRRILTSAIAFEPAQMDADDFYLLTDRDIPASTAIHNGARFPYISPAGTLKDRQGVGAGHIVDGGYFEAAGVEAMRELQRSILAVASEKDQQNLRFIFVYIGYEQGAPRKPPARVLFNEAVAPLVAMLQSRSAHAAHLARELKLTQFDDVDAYRAAQGETPPDPKTAEFYAPVMLCRQVKGERGATTSFEPPMDWALSDCAKEYMRRATGAGESLAVDDQGRRNTVCAAAQALIPCAAGNEALVNRVATQVLAAKPKRPRPVTTASPG